MGTDYKTFYCFVLTQEASIFSGFCQVTKAVNICFGDIFCFYGHFQDLSHFIT